MAHWRRLVGAVLAAIGTQVCDPLVVAWSPEDPAEDPLHVK